MGTKFDELMEFSYESSLTQKLGNSGFRLRPRKSKNQSDF
jgi:hypothetical protein